MTADRHGDDVQDAEAVAKVAHEAWRAAQLEHPERRAWLPLMIIIAVLLLALDSWAAYFAAEALGGGQKVALLWTAQFLVILGLLEAGLAWSAERSNRKAFRLITLALGVFVIMLALLRFGFFDAVGTGLLAAVIGAAVFAACTSMFVIGGFVAIRRAETMEIWQARRRARKATRRAYGTTASARRRVGALDYPQQKVPGRSMAGPDLLVVNIATMAGWLVSAAAWLLPTADRTRYYEEYRSELWELAAAETTPRQQMQYALRQLGYALPLRFAVLSPRRKKASP
jgi:hypothetical protein